MTLKMKIYDGMMTIEEVVGLILGGNYSKRFLLPRSYGGFFCPKIETGRKICGTEYLIGKLHYRFSV